MDQQRLPTSPAPRSGSRSFSFRSDKSANSTGKSNREKLVESPGEKERRDSIWKADSKANPNAAMTEAQPGEINLLEKATIEPLRNYQHKDTRGNVITDPDLSNPTRPRMERPLDTIRSFERAIDSGYKRRSVLRGESYNEQNSSQYASRRSSYIGGYDNGRQSQGGYYGNRHPDGQYGQQRRMMQRFQSDPATSRGTQGGYPQHAYHQSHDTMQTNGSDSTGPWANSTDPSSENSSVERMYPAKQGWGNDVIAEERGPINGYTNAYNAPNTYQDQAPQQPRHTIPLGDMAPPVPKKALPAVPRPSPERRKSRLSRLFSKKD